MNTLVSSPTDAYWQYLKAHCPTLEPELLTHLKADLEKTAWDEPETALDLNNIAVIALIEAEQTEDASLRAMSLEMALEALTQGAEMQPTHPLCIAHLALVRSLIGETNAAFQIAFPMLINLVQPAYNAEAALPLGLIYLPTYLQKGAATRSETLSYILRAEEGYIQALRLLAETLCQLQLVFYNQSGKRFLQLASMLMPDSVGLNLKLGLASLMSNQWEGLLNLQQARASAPEFAPVIQALHLAYRQLQPKVAEYWLQYGQECTQDNSNALEWRWATLSSDSSFTYIAFDQNLLLAVDPSIHSIVTTVLLAEGDWFEAEMEFWRNQLQPGMTVIDVGANVGVYAFSAAQKVGATGQVFAVEPFSSCVRCLEETRRLNELDWVKICAGAASDSHSTARLSLQASSELNEVVTDTAAVLEGDLEEITCFPLDSLIESEKLTHVDWLKIDAEGHEMQVLAGCEQILAQFAPGIIYENIAGAKGSNTAIGEYLQAKGYELFYYQPYLQNLIPIHSVDDIQGNLNIIALPAES